MTPITAAIDSIRRRRLEWLCWTSAYLIYDVWLNRGYDGWFVGVILFAVLASPVFALLAVAEYNQKIVPSTKFTKHTLFGALIWIAVGVLGVALSRQPDDEILILIAVFAAVRAFTMRARSKTTA